jgi:hypothetical protein
MQWNSSFCALYSEGTKFCSNTTSACHPGPSGSMAARALYRCDAYAAKHKYMQGFEGNQRPNKRIAYHFIIKCACYFACRAGAKWHLAPPLHGQLRCFRSKPCTACLALQSQVEVTKILKKISVAMLDQES